MASLLQSLVTFNIETQITLSTPHPSSIEFSAKFSIQDSESFPVMSTVDHYTIHHSNPVRIISSLHPLPIIPTNPSWMIPARAELRTLGLEPMYIENVVQALMGSVNGHMREHYLYYGFRARIALHAKISRVNVMPVQYCMYPLAPPPIAAEPLDYYFPEYYYDYGLAQLLEGMEDELVPALAEGLGNYFRRGNYDESDEVAGEVMERLERVRSDEEERLKEESCAICLEDMVKKEGGDKKELVRLGCKHIFHKDCLLPWFKKKPHANCPLCRSKIRN